MNDVNIDQSAELIPLQAATAGSLPQPAFAPPGGATFVSTLSGQSGNVVLSGGATGFSYSAGAGVITLTLTIAAGAIAFGNAGGNGLATDATHLFWDDANNRLGVGTNAPGVDVDVVSAAASTDLRVRDGSRTVVTSSNFSGSIAGIGTTTNSKFGIAANSVLAIVVDGSQNVGIGTSSPATSAKLEISSTTGALLLPRMTTTQRDALTAVSGMLIYNSTDGKFQGFEAGAWTNLI